MDETERIWIYFLQLIWLCSHLETELSVRVGVWFSKDSVMALFFLGSLINMNLDNEYKEDESVLDMAGLVYRQRAECVPPMLLCFAVAVAPAAAQRSQRTKRGLLELAGAIECSTGRSALAYLMYGCYCGLGGQGWPRDKTDWWGPWLQCVTVVTFSWPPNVHKTRHYVDHIYIMCCKRYYLDLHFWMVCMYDFLFLDAFTSSPPEILRLIFTISFSHWTTNDVWRRVWRQNTAEIHGPMGTEKLPTQILIAIFSFLTMRRQAPSNQLTANYLF